MSNEQNRERITTFAQVEQLDRDHPGDMVKGYLDGFKGAPWPETDPSPAYEHGRRNGVSDRTGESDEDQGAIARDYVRRSRASLKAGKETATKAAKARGYRLHPRLAPP